MKKLVSVLCFMLAFCAVLSPACSAEEENYDTLPSWNVRITVPEDSQPANFRAPFHAEGVHDLYLVTDGPVKLYSWIVKK